MGVGFIEHYFVPPPPPSSYTMACKHAGLSQDLVAYSEAEYTDLAVQLLSNSSLLSQTRARVHAADMAPIFSTVEADAYVPLFKWFANADQVCWRWYLRAV